MRQRALAVIADLLSKKLRHEELSSNKERLAPSILEPCWVGELEGILRIDPALQPFCPWRDDLEVCVAGKSSSPDEASRNMAAKVLGSEGFLLSGLLEKYSEVFREPEWNLKIIWFPYQNFRYCWYATFESEYGAENEFAFVADSLQADNVEIELVGLKRGSFVDAPGFVHYAISELKSAGVRSSAFNEVLRRIREEHIFGVELVMPLLRILEDCSQDLDPLTYRHLNELLRPIVVAAS